MQSMTELKSCIRSLVQRNDLACDTESGLCRFCGAVVESSRPEEIEPHNADCPWQRARIVAGFQREPARAVHSGYAQSDMSRAA